MTFRQIQRTALGQWEALENSEEPRIYINTATCGRSSGAIEVLEHINSELKQKNISARVIEVGCIGLCYLEPLVYIAKWGRPSICYGHVTPETASQLVNDYLLNDNPRTDLAFCSMGEGKIDSIPPLSELPVFKQQVRIALRNCGYIDPENINHYIANNGYSSLARALKMTPLEVIEEVSRSGLRGRGGAGYFTADKWRICHDAAASEKYVICNAVDADPQAVTARLLLESDPHSVLEGMLIGAYAVGASHCIVYINAEYSLAIERLRKALEQMRKYSLLGNNILDSTFSSEIEVKEVPVSLVSGEETALLRSLEGKQAMPYVRPPYPAISGFRDKPTLINNLETLSNIPAILHKGPEWYSGFGTEQSKGTKVITLSGKVAHKCTVEVPLRTTLQNIVKNIGGGGSNGKNIKAVQFGGPTGVYFAPNSLDISVDYEAIKEAGSIIGSGTIEVFDSDACAVEMAKDKISYLHTQSCGKCVFCREGSLQMSDILQDITEYNGRPQDLDLLVELGETMKMGCICGLGQNASNPVLSSIKLFRSEYDAHIKEKSCPIKSSR